MDILKQLAKLENEAADFGFQWEDASQIMAQIRSECSEIETHLEDGNAEKLQEECGDLLHAVFSLCIFKSMNPLETLEMSVNKFEKRFNAVKKLAQEQGYATLKGQSFECLMKFWDQSKQLVG